MLDLYLKQEKTIVCIQIWIYYAILLFKLNFNAYCLKDV